MSIFGTIIFQLVEWIGFDKNLLKERKHSAFDTLGLAYQAEKSRHTVHEKPCVRIETYHRLK